LDTFVFETKTKKQKQKSRRKRRRRRKRERDRQTDRGTKTVREAGSQRQTDRQAYSTRQLKATHEKTTAGLLKYLSVDTLATLPPKEKSMAVDESSMPQRA